MQRYWGRIDDEERMAWTGWSDEGLQETVRPCAQVRLAGWKGETMLMEERHCENGGGETIME